MTWLQWAIARLVDRGMFEDQAKLVMDAVMANPSNEAMRNRWNTAVDNYPTQMQAVCWMSIAAEALEWIDKNCPNAWFRGMFVPESHPSTPSADVADTPST